MFNDLKLCSYEYSMLVFISSISVALKLNGIWLIVEVSSSAVNGSRDGAPYILAQHKLHLSINPSLNIPYSDFNSNCTQNVDEGTKGHMNSTIQQSVTRVEYGHECGIRDVLFLIKCHYGLVS
jgi:hypothetical protein